MNKVKSLSTLSPNVALLAVNEIPEFPEMAIKSILTNSDAEIYLGYVRLDDIKNISNHPRVHLIKLNSDVLTTVNDRRMSYQGWETQEFFEIVQLKWDLLLRVLEISERPVIYSDIDVIWLSDAAKEISDGFEIRREVDIFIQSFTYNINFPRLCMGFVAFRNNTEVRAFIKSAKAKHSDMYKENKSIGDDDVITALYSELNYPRWICELPQTSFPVGKYINNFNRKSAFPGIVADRPFIFHANFVVGISNKLLLAKVFLNSFDGNKYGSSLTYRLRLILWLKRLKNVLRGLR